MPVKTHAEIVNMLKERERTLKTEFGLSDMGLVSASVEYKPVPSVCVFVGGLAPAGFDRLKTYLVAELGLPVEVIEMAKANGSFRYVFTLRNRERRNVPCGIEA